MCYRLLKKYTAKDTEKAHILDELLEKAHIKIRAEVYIAYTWMSTIIAACVGVVFVLLMILIVAPLVGIFPFLMNFIFLGIGILMPLGTYLYLSKAPTMKAKERAKDIEKNLPYAANYMAAMASAEVTPTAIFRGLAGQRIYGEIQKEAALIYRDIEMMGRDLMRVLHDAIARSPSIKFQEFLQGIITTSISGGDLKIYFMTKAEQYMKENRVEQRGTLETLGVLAESFVTVVVAAPLFLIVMMSVMAMMGGGGMSMTMLYIIVGLMIPLCQLMFIIFIRGMKL
jgi:flagellar protein FlaJ